MTLISSKPEIFIDSWARQIGKRLIGNIAASLSQVSRDDIIERSLAHFRKVDDDFDRRLAGAIAQRRS